MITVINDDCITATQNIDDDSIDAIVTDPPYGLTNIRLDHVVDTISKWAGGALDYVPSTGKGFVGHEWDKFVPPPAAWKEAYRVLKPGGHALIFCGTRTQDLMGISVRLAGFEVRDSLMWIYGEGFPKSHNIGKAIDKAAGAEWDGFGTALKPAHEPILLVRKPFTGTVADNVLTHGVGGLNIDGCRIGTETMVNPPGSTKPRVAMGGGWREDAQPTIASGRWPANVAFDDAMVDELNKQHKGASRFFYHAKASKAERPVIETDGKRIVHPTVKPLTLMRWLVRLVTPPNGTVLDMFAGTGTTGAAAELEGFNSILIERDEDYVQLIRKRIETKT